MSQLTYKLLCFTGEREKKNNKRSLKLEFYVMNSGMFHILQHMANVVRC
jgi:hypothetical protein